MIILHNRRPNRSWQWMLFKEKESQLAWESAGLNALHLVLCIEMSFYKSKKLKEPKFLIPTGKLLRLSCLQTHRHSNIHQKQLKKLQPLPMSSHITQCLCRQSYLSLKYCKLYPESCVISCVKSDDMTKTLPSKSIVLTRSPTMCSMTKDTH